jgi:HK97 family phage major capsid protein
MPYDGLVSRVDASGVIPDAHVELIIAATAAQSISLSLFRQVNMGTGIANLPYMATLPDAYWVNGDTGLKQTTDLSLSSVPLVAEELAVIVPVPNSVLEDASIDLWAQIRPELAAAFGRKIDRATIAGTEKPATFATALIPGATAAGNVVTADNTPAEGGIAGDLGEAFTAVEADGYDVSGIAANRTLRGLLRGARDSGGQPLADVSTGFASYEGVPISYAPAGALGTTPPVPLAVVGDFNLAVLGVRQDITYDISTDGVISDETGRVILNLLQQDSSAMRAVMRIAFQVVKPANEYGNAADATVYPFAVLNPAGP